MFESSNTDPSIYLPQEDDPAAPLSDQFHSGTGFQPVPNSDSRGIGVSPVSASLPNQNRALEKATAGRTNQSNPDTHSIGADDPSPTDPDHSPPFVPSPPLPPPTPHQRESEPP